MRALALLITLSAIACSSAARTRVAEKPSLTEQEKSTDWERWTDDDNDCQNTREEVLIEQSEIPVSFKTEKQCEVAAGRWTCPFTGEVFTSPSSLTVARVVPLATVNAAGGRAWNTEKKVTFANELGKPSHLIVVSAVADQARAKRAPDSWLPENQDYVCEYLERWIGTKMHYQLATNSKILKLHISQCLGPVKFCGRTWPLETTSISCDDATLTSLRPLARLKSLTHLDLYAVDQKTMSIAPNQVSDLNPLAALANLRSVKLTSSNVSDLTPLARLSNLEQLHLNGKNISDIKPLAKLGQLVWLELDDTSITDLAPLAELASLSWLTLKAAKVSNFEPLARLTNLRNLDLSATQISDLQPLAKLTSLVHLVLNDTPITDLQPLATLSSLEKLDINSTKVAFSEANKLRTAKPTLEIDF